MCVVCVCTVYACLFTIVLYIQLWLCLGALCVIDEHHAEVLSSGQWMGQDGKPRTKVATLLTHQTTATHYEDIKLFLSYSHYVTTMMTALHKH